jgi:hypothetical protein
LSNKSFGIRIDITGDAFDIVVCQKGAAIAFTAVTAFAAFKEHLGLNGVRGHDGSPELFSR